MFQAVKTFLDPLKTRLNPLVFRFQQFTQVVEMLTHGIAQIIDSAVLEEHSKQVTAADNSDGTPTG